MPAPKKISRAQERALLQMIRQNPNLTTARGVGITPEQHTNSREFWDIVAYKLNSLGSETKTAQKWRDYWSELKYRVRKKAKRIKALAEPTRNLKLTEVDEEILEMMQDPDVSEDTFISFEDSSASEEAPRIASQSPPTLTPSSPAFVPVLPSPVERSHFVTVPDIKTHPEKIEPLKEEHRSYTEPDLFNEFSRVASVEEKRLKIEEISAKARQDTAIALEQCASAMQAMAQAVVTQANVIADALKAQGEMIAKALSNR